MGSYLTIVNDTTDTWQCKVGPDMKALKIVGISGFIISAVTGTIAAVGGAAALVTCLFSSGMLSFFGIPLASLVTVTTAAAPFAIPSTIAGGVSLFSVATAKSVSLALDDRGYKMILPGTSYRYEKMTLSLWQQSECIKTTVNETTVLLDKLYMRPIFSGSTMNSNRNHMIQYWINKKGTEQLVVRGENGTMPQEMNGMMNFIGTESPQNATESHNSTFKEYFGHVSNFFNLTKHDP